ncbi:MAG TPA: peroxidase-related enzyme [Capsulimonadaceae bacterium]|nr:peroxidase-related enzyme [Capsulimonadaceae bacterium]
MAHLKLPEGLPGIRGPLAAYPETAEHIGALAQALLLGPSSLSPGERELIAAYVSSLNECSYCARSHAESAKYLLDTDTGIVDQVLDSPESAAISPKFKTLLVIAGKVQQGGRRVTEEDIALARSHGADDKALHDTVLIAAAFCMFNRYVDGLDTDLPHDPAFYEAAGRFSVDHGYTVRKP